MDELRLALIGCGHHGLSLGGRMLELHGARWTVTADVDPESARHASTQLGARSALDPEAACSSSDVDAVVIATPNFTHRPIVEAAAAAGKHIFCEKPMALTVEDCDAMLATAGAAGVKLMVGHMQRLLPLLAAVRWEVQSGTLGPPVAVSMTRRDQLLRGPGWLREREKVGGLLFQSSVHEFDWLRSTFGEVRQVFSQAAARRIQPYLDFADTVFTQLTFADGTVGALQACMSDHVQVYTGAINGTEGSIHFDLNRGEMCLVRPGKERQINRATDWSPSAAHGYAGREILAGFLRWVREDEPPPVTAWDGRQAVTVARAAEESIATGQPVELSEASLGNPAEAPGLWRGS